MNDNELQLDFADVLAASVHDIKNSIAMTMSTLNALLEDPETRIGDRGKLHHVQLEAQRANHNLIQLLSLYKLGRGQLAAHVAEVSVEDLLADIDAENRPLAEAMGVTLECDCDELLAGYFDENLVRGVINAAIGNAKRYTESTIRVSADEEDGYLVLRVEDDGAGYPAQMVEALAQSDSQGSDFKTGRTQLGLIFAAQVARIHRVGDRAGFIRLRNHVSLPGGCFELWLP
jgi:signal transduction histidine kinase